MCLRASDLQRMGWTLLETRLIPDWCGCSVEYLPVLAGDGWVLVPIWEPRSDADPAAEVGAGSSVLGGRSLTWRV